MKILLPTDGSEYSEASARFLGRLQLSDNDEIYVLHVVGDDPFQDKEDYYYVKIRETKQMIAPKIIDSALHVLKSVPARINTLLMNGYPDKCIVDAAVTSNCDLIIMGPKRLKGVTSRIIGSVTKSVSIMSPKSVLVIKPSQTGPSERIKILFATDGSEYARKAGETLALIPFHDDTEITVLHVVTPAFYDIPDKFMAKIDENVREDLNRHSSAEFNESKRVIEQTVQNLGSKFRKTGRLTRTGDPSDEILTAAKELNADIIVVGSKGMGGFRGVVGSISRYILSVADCSVLIGKTAAI
jgi:nucleotide-binding universal stress UspA family protein